MKLIFTLLFICFVSTIFSQNIEAALQGKLTDSVKSAAPTKNFIINCGCGNKHQKLLFFIDGMISDSVNYSILKPNDIRYLEIVKPSISGKLFGEKAKDGAIIIYMKEISDSTAANIISRRNNKYNTIRDPAPRHSKELFFVINGLSQDSVRFNNNSIDAFYKGFKNTIAIDEIEKSVFLNNAKTAAVYGSRGANGVVFVETKNLPTQKILPRL